MKHDHVVNHVGRANVLVSRERRLPFQLARGDSNELAEVLALPHVSVPRWTDYGSTLLCVSLLLLVGLPIDAHAASESAREKPAVRTWPGFRGPGSNGHSLNASPPLTWSVEDDRNILWKTKVPKPGMSSPVVWGDRLFLTGADPFGRELYCLDANSGKLLWKHSADDIPGSPPNDKLPEVMDKPGLAAPTPTTNGRFVAAIFATGDLVGVNMNGERVWAKNLGVPDNHYGHSSSLICEGDRLFVQYDQNKGSRLLAFELATGNVAWEVNRGPIAWSSPILIENKGRKELVLTNCKAIDSYDPATGKLLWHVPGLDGEVATSAAYAGGVVCVANEYAAAAAIDVRDHDAEPKILWAWDEVLPDAASPLANERHLIVPSGYGIVNCLETKTGRVLWEHEFDEGFYSSPILVKDRVYLGDLSGTVHVFKMADTFELLGASSVGEEVYATPAFVGDRIYIRGLTHLFCIEEKE